MRDPLLVLKIGALSSCAALILVGCGSPPLGPGTLCSCAPSIACPRVLGSRPLTRQGFGLHSRG
eukprot:scaffold97321_cov32-Tisochrysis_lutea.AAC.1